MPPHCDSIDGPVATAAAQALDTGDVALVLPYVHQDGEQEVRAAFDLARRARGLGADAREVADRWFFETAVRVHRTGEGAPFTGLKPAGLDVGPVIPLAEQAIEAGSPDALVDFLTDVVRLEASRRFEEMLRLKAAAGGDVEHARAYVQAMLGLEVWSHHLYRQALASAHGESGHG